MDASTIEKSNKKAIRFSSLVADYFSGVVNGDADGSQKDDDDDDDHKILSNGTITNYQRMSQIFIKHFKNKSVNKISRQEIIRYHRSLKKTPYEANREIAFLRVLLEFAKDEGHIDMNPADQIKKFKEKKHQLKLDEHILFKKIYPVAAPMLKRAIMLAFHLVQHETEVKHLTWTDFKLEAKKVSFTRSKTDELIVINYSKNRTLIDCHEYLRSSRRELSPSIICHSSSEGWVPYNHFRSLWKSALKKAGYIDDAGVPQFKFKEIRHLANTRMKDADITVDKRKAMTGHKTNQANEIYTHPSGSDTIDASQALSSFRPDKF